MDKLCVQSWTEHLKSLSLHSAIKFTLDAARTTSDRKLSENRYLV